MTAIQLAKRYGEDPEKAEIAGILHDSVKYADQEWLRQSSLSENMDPILIRISS